MPNHGSCDYYRIFAIEGEMGQLPVAMAYDKAAIEGRAINYSWTASWVLARMQVMTGLQANGTMERFSQGAYDSRWTGSATPEQRSEIVDLIAESQPD